jgi:hypothetical protein
MRVGRAMAVLPTSLSLALALAAATLVARKVMPDRVPDDWAWALLYGAGLSVVLALLVAVLRRLPPYAGALALDRHHGLRGRLTTALELSRLPAGERTPLMKAALQDACAHAEELSPRRAVAIRLPPELAISVGVGAAVALLALLEVRRAPVVAEVAAAPSIVPLEMAPDDLELFRDAADALERQDQSPEVQAAIERFNELIEDIANRRLNRTEAFRRMEEIEEDLLKGAEADAMAFEEALQETAKELHNSELTDPLAKSLDKKDLDQAKKDLQELADTLRGKGKTKPDKKQLERLRKALDRASSRKKKALDNINERRAELREQLLKKKRERPDAGAPEEKEERLLRKKRRELERLDREAERRARAARRLSRLDRDLAKAAADLLRELGLSADDLDQAAEDINRLQQEQLTDQEKEQLRKRLQELRELIRQQGQGGKKRLARLLRFGQRARGGKSLRPGQGGDKQSGGSKPGQGPGGQGDKTFVLGPGGKKIPVLGPGAGQGAQGNESGGGSDQPGGQGIGSEPGGDPMGQPTDPKMDTVDVRAEGVDTKQGPTNAEVILSAAERGFEGRPYRDVYRKYRTVAEDQIDTETIPDGYRFYVRRYFQLIRPRE